MIGRKALAMVAVLALGAGLVASDAMGMCSRFKNRTKGCKNEIKACTVAECAELTGREKRLCKTACRTDVKNACKADPTVCTGSASAAFLD